MTFTKSPTPFETASMRKLSVRNALATCSALAALSVLAFAQTGCSSSEPLSSDLAIILPETGRAIAGYNDTDYVYPIRVPNTNRFVQMRTKEPLDHEPTYEDYLKWKKGN